MNQVIYLRALSDASVAPCLVLVDMQQEYVTGSRLMALPDADLALANCRAALAHAPQRLDRQRVQEVQHPPGRDDDQPVRLGPRRGQLGHELARRNPH